jgi:hypothetical protein
MARFYAFAEVLTEDHPRWQQLYAPLLDRFGPPRGIKLQDFLDRSGGRYEKKLHLADTFRERARILAEATGDEQLLRIAGQAEYTMSLEHLRGTDLDAWITCGYGLEASDEEEALLPPHPRGKLT